MLTKASLQGCAISQYSLELLYFGGIGTHHILDGITDGQGNKIPTLQYYIKKYLKNYNKKIFTIEFTNNDTPSFELVDSNEINAVASWPAWDFED
ncbi:MAG: hypothetical protein GY750_09720 [Lentisphaerae bacterium]|nr:hypothetical protein [Lentisphaerota bacterium]MCP4101688.1 hypothetical protein [Lentisphaerota bacterium]